jgi:hypothetical protein
MDEHAIARWHRIVERCDPMASMLKAMQQPR